MVNEVVVGVLVVFLNIIDIERIVLTNMILTHTENEKYKYYLSDIVVRKVEEGYVIVFVVD